MIDKGKCDNQFIYNPTICECECDKPRDAGDCSGYENCKCKKKTDWQISVGC